MGSQPEERDPIKDARELRDRALGAKLQTGTRRQIAIGGAAGTSLVLLSTLGGMRPFDEWLNVALYALTVALGCLAVAFYDSTMRYDPPKDFWDEVYAASRVVVFRGLGEGVGLIAAGVGIVAYLGHFGQWAGVAFGAIIIGLPVLWIAGAGMYGLVYALRHRAKGTDKSGRAQA